MKKNKTGFTLIEIVVSVAIFSIIMISMISIYILSTDVTLKSDINRAMHENIKSVITDISESVIKNGIKGVSESQLDLSCDLVFSSQYKSGTKLCIDSNEYILATKNISGDFVRADNVTCSSNSEQCYIIKDGYPLTNSLVTIKSLNFIVTNTYVPKVTISIVAQPTIKAGVKPNLIEQNKLIFQTTISQRPF